MFESLFFVVFSVNQWLICCFSNRGEQISMGHLKESEIGFINIYLLRIGSKNGPNHVFLILTNNGKAKNDLEYILNRYINIYVYIYIYK